MAKQETFYVEPELIKKKEIVVHLITVHARG